MANIHWSPSLLLHLQRQSPSARVGRAHRCAWANWPVLARTTSLFYSSLPTATSHRAPWANQPTASAAHRTPYANWPAASATHRLRYSLLLAASHRTPWADSTPAAARHRALWRLLTSAAAAHRAPYSVRTTHPAAARHRAPWLHLSAALIQSVANTPELTYAGRTLALVSASLSADESAAHWLAALHLASATDYARLHMGAAIALSLPQGSFALIIDGLAVQRSAAADVAYTASAISPLALQDAPYAALVDVSYPQATLASSAVQALLGPVQWLLPDWAIPAGALAITQATPLAAARAIVGAVGGVVESLPDGSVCCRLRHPVSPPDYTLALCTHTFDDDAVLSASARLAPLAGFNLVQVSNSTDTSASASADALEYVPDDASATTGTVRARLASQRPVLLVHSGHPATQITAQGSVTRLETELVEFVAGQASLQYGADSIAACTWQHVDLGTPTVSPGDPSAISTSTPGYSLAQISYHTTALQWLVALAGPAQAVQFILTDA